MKNCLILLLLVFFAFPAQAADDHSSIFEKGNAYYEKGEYDQAVREYTKLTGQGIESGNLYFNLGNCYYRKGEIGKAILYYEKARRLIPGDSDLKSNYAYVISKAGNSGQQMPGSWTKRTSGVFNNLTTDGLTILVSAMYMLAVFLFIAAMFFRIRKRYIVILTTLLLAVLITGGASLYGRISALDRDAVVVAKGAESKFEPSDSATTHFTLSEGMKVYIIEKKDDWVKIGRPDGKAGWVKKGMIESY